MHGGGGGGGGGSGRLPSAAAVCIIGGFSMPQRGMLKSAILSRRLCWCSFLVQAWCRRSVVPLDGAVDRLLLVSPVG